MCLVGHRLKDRLAAVGANSFAANATAAGFPVETNAMRFLRRLGFEGLAWSLRRLHCPVDASALVLEIGAGGNPYPRANVLLDAYERTPERVESDLTRDRPVVLAMAERLPFRDKVFDFAIASHVLEHSADPEAFLNEMMRVARAGYIETPDAFFERINPFTYHRLEVTDRDGTILIYKKPSWRHDSYIVDLYERKLKDSAFIRYASTHPAPFYMRFYWRDLISFRIENPETDASWPLPPEAHAPRRKTLRSRLKSLYLPLVRRLFSQNLRNRELDWLRLLQCPTCRSTNLESSDGMLKCPACQATYPVKDDVPVLFPVQRVTVDAATRPDLT